LGVVAPNLKTAKQQQQLTAFFLGNTKWSDHCLIDGHLFLQFQNMACQVRICLVFQDYIISFTILFVFF
jgi:hypothetical protein